MQKNKPSLDARYKLLSLLAASPMPAQVTDPEAIVDLLSLHAAGLIEGDLPQQVWVGLSRGWSGPAVVRRLTKSGQQALAARR